MITTLLEILACVLFAAGVAIVAATLIGGGVGVGVGCILAALPFLALSYVAGRV